MLLNIVQGTEAGSFIVIKDTVKYSGRGILKCFINAALKRGEDVHVLGFETSETEVCAGLESGCVQKVNFHKGHPDPLGWTGRSSFTVKQFTTRDITRLVQNTQHAKASVIVVDSLSFVLRHHQPVVICQRLQELKRSRMFFHRNTFTSVSSDHTKLLFCFLTGGVVKTIVGLLHSDLHLQSVVDSMCHFASAVISVAPVNNEHHGMAKTTRRTKSGKVKQEEEYFSVSEDATLSVQTQPHPPGHVQTEQNVADADPTSNLTFNLRLSKEEKEAKEKVALPFVFSQEKKSALLRPIPGSGRIMYEPDANDDFDEEDPDDDLDV